MSMDFGKLNFAVGFNRTSAFPLDANSYFESYTDAVAAAASAAVVGSSDSAYYIGQLIIVNESGKFGLYQIGANKTLVKFGQASSADDLKSQLDALAATVEGLNNSKADWFGGTAPVDKNGEIVTIGAAGSITASGIKIVNSAVNNSTTEVPTSKAVQTYIASQVASAVQYLGTVSALTGLSTTAGKGDFYRLSAAVAGGHAGDLVIAEKDNPAQLIDGTNWSLIHGEEVGVEAINAGDGIKVITTGEGSSEAQPTIAMKPATTTTIGGIIVGTNLTVDATGKLSATDTTYEDATTTTHGLMSTADKSKLDGIEANAPAVTSTTVTGWGFTKNAGTITGIKMNGSSKGTSGVVDLGTVLTAHQAIKINGTAITPGTLNLKAGSNVTFNNSNGTLTINSSASGTDTKNTAGSSNSTSKLYLVGATSQSSAGVTTYSNANVYATDGSLFSTNLTASGAIESNNYYGKLQTQWLKFDVDQYPGFEIYADDNSRILVDATLTIDANTDFTITPTVNNKKIVVSDDTTAYKIKKLTQAQYNALQTKDASTIYLIVG